MPSHRSRIQTALLLLVGLLARPVAGQPREIPPALADSLRGGEPDDGAWRGLGLPEDFFPGAVPRFSLPPEARARGATITQADASGRWIELPPPRRSGAAAVYDVTRDRLVVFGGSNRGRLQNATWALSLGEGMRWAEMAEQGTHPTPRSWSANVYDPIGERLVIFGGAGYGDLEEGAYELNLEGAPRWSPIATPPGEPAPPARYGASAIYDSRRGRMIVYGGWGREGPTSDVWALDLGPRPHWRQLVPDGAVPDPRFFHAAAYDSAGDRMVIFGGEVVIESRYIAVTDELWELSLGDSMTWTRPKPEGESPGARAGHQMINDPVGGGFLVFGGSRAANDVFRLIPRDTPRWTRLRGSGDAAIPRSGLDVVYDSARDRFLAFGGTQGGNDPIDVDAFSPRPAPTWARLGSGRLASARFGHAWVHDSRRDRAVIFGGQTAAGYLTDPWALSLEDPTHWEPLEVPGDGPPARHEPVGVYDPLRDRAVFFGGWTYLDNYFNDAWILSFAGPLSWTRASPGGETPPARRGHAAAYDPLRDRMLVFGGYDGSHDLDDLWALDLTGDMHWEKLSPQGPGPAGRSFSTLTYDPLRDRLILIGGWSGPTSVSDNWQLGLSNLRWEPLASHASPGRHTTVFDTENDRLLVFGGWYVDYDVISSTNAVFSLELRDRPAWSLLQPLGDSPPSPGGHTALFDPVRDRMVVFGGAEGPGSYLNDTWLLEFSSPVIRGAWLVGSRFEAGRLSLVWQSADGPGVSARLERREIGGDWVTLGDAVANSDSRFEYQDADVRTGLRYTYRLRALSGGGELLSGEAIIDVPGEPVLRLFGAWPNPARSGDITLWVALGESPAKVELFDLDGRRVWETRISGGTSGVRLIRAEKRLQPGLYLARVSQGDRATTGKITILR